MFETSEEGGNLAQMRLIWYQKALQIQIGAVKRYNRERAGTVVVAAFAILKTA